MPVSSLDPNLETKSRPEGMGSALLGIASLKRAGGGVEIFGFSQSRLQLLKTAVITQAAVIPARRRKQLL
jgi:hypothetical protein